MAAFLPFTLSGAGEPCRPLTTNAFECSMPPDRSNANARSSEVHPEAGLLPLPSLREMKMKLTVKRSKLVELNRVSGLALGPALLSFTSPNCGETNPTTLHTCGPTCHGVHQIDFDPQHKTV